jgi:hypothetical protein
MQISTATYFSIDTEDKSGQLAAINAALLDKNVPLRAIWGFGTTGGRAQVVVVPEDPQIFKAATKEFDWRLNEGGCFWITGEDKTGALVELLQKIAKEGLGILALDAVAMDGKFGCYILASDNDFSAIAQILGVRSALT